MSVTFAEMVQARRERRLARQEALKAWQELRKAKREARAARSETSKIRAENKAERALKRNAKAKAKTLEAEAKLDALVDSELEEGAEIEELEEEDEDEESEVVAGSCNHIPLYGSLVNTECSTCDKRSAMMTIGALGLVYGGIWIWRSR